MNRNFIRFVAIIIIAIIFGYAFSGSYASHSLDNIAYVIALGVDLADDQNNIKVTFEFTDVSSFSNNSSSESSSPILNTVTSNSINGAINLMNAYSGKEISLSHCKIVVFSEELAKLGIMSEITELISNIQVRPSINIVISKTQANDYIKNSTSSLEKILTKYYDIFPNSSEYTGYTSNITIGDFYNSLINSDSGSIAILGGVNEASASSDNESSEQNQGQAQNSSSEQGQNSSQDSSSGSNQGNSQGSSSESNQSESENSSSETNQNETQNSSSESSQNESQNTTSEETQSNSDASSSKGTNSDSSFDIIAGESSIVGERGTENIGIAVFKEDKLIGNLTAIETLCHSIIKDEVDSFFISIEDPNDSNSFIDISLLEDTYSKISVEIDGDTPVINVDVFLEGRILSVLTDVDYSDTVMLDSISDATNIYLEEHFLEYLNKTSTEFNCDIDNFFDYAKKHFLTVQDWENFNWSSKYGSARFNVNIEANISFS